MRIYPAPHYTMGGLWVDYNLMSTIPGLFVVGEANFSDHGANRLGASALMQGLGDGYFILPYTIGGYFAGEKLDAVSTGQPEFNGAAQGVKSQIDKLLSIGGKRPVDSFHRELGHLMWNRCGMARNEDGLRQTIGKIRELREEFWSNLKLLGAAADLNMMLEHAGRVADFMEFAELLCTDALDRKESCGGHFREESQTAEGEARRDDENFCHVSAWEYTGIGSAPRFHKEPLVFENVHLVERSYK
jgi:succinate dehydrogenase / fumarate reductase flavoprotein subunit